MKKITLFSLFVFCAILVNAQNKNMVTNPSMESWTNGRPDGWTVSVTGGITQDATTVIDGVSSAKIVATGTSNLTQEITLTEGKTYILTFSYYIATGDGTDARIWSNFKTAKGSNSWWTMTQADSTALKGPGGKDGYFPDVKNKWNATDSITFVVPTGYPVLSLQVRNYKGSTVCWDNFSVIEKSGSGSGINAQSTKTSVPFVVGRTLMAEAENGTLVTLYNTLGQKVLATKIENGQASLAGVSTGLYIVKVGDVSSSKLLVK